MTAVSEVTIRGGAAWERVTDTIAAVAGAAPTWERSDPMIAVSFGTVRVGSTTVSVTDNEPADAVMLILKVDDLQAAADRLSEIDADFDPDSSSRLWVRAGALQLVVDTEDGCDAESRATLYRVLTLAMPLVNALEGLSPAAATRIGLTADRLRDLELLASAALWRSTADLNQQGRDELAKQVIARAAELAAEEGS